MAAEQHAAKLEQELSASAKESAQVARRTAAAHAALEQRTKDLSLEFAAEHAKLHADNQALTTELSSVHDTASPPS